MYPGIDVTCLCRIVPFQGQSAAIAFSVPVETDLIVFAEGGNEMFGVGSVGVAHAEVVDDEAEDGVAGGMAPEAMSEGARCIAVGGEVGDKLVVGEAACLGKAVHSATDFDVDEAIVEEGFQVVLGNDCRGSIQMGTRMYS